MKLIGMTTSVGPTQEHHRQHAEDHEPDAARGAPAAGLAHRQSVVQCAEHVAHADDARREEQDDEREAHEHERHRRGQAPVELLLDPGRDEGADHRVPR